MLDSESNLIHTEATIARQALLHKYMLLGGFEPEEMGFPKGGGIILLKQGLNRSPLFQAGANTELGYNKSGELIAVGYNSQNQVREAVRPFENVTPVGLDQDVCEKLTAANRFLVGESYIVDGFYDLLQPASLVLAYYAAQLLANPHRTAEFPGFSSADNHALYRRIAIETPFIQRLIFSSPLSDIPEMYPIAYAQAAFETIDNTLRVLVQGDRKRAHDIFYGNQNLVTLMGIYLSMIIATGEYKTMFRGPTGEYNPNLLERVILTFVKAEGDVMEEETSHFFSVKQSRFSSYVGLALDMALQQEMPYAFAFGNEALLRAIRLEDADYFTRIRATRVNLNIRGFGLQTVNKLVEMGEDVMPITVAPKSVFSTLGTALQAERDRLMEFAGVSLDSSLPQLVQDFKNIRAFEVLVKAWSKGEVGEDIQVFIEKIYRIVRTTTDVARATAFMPDESFNDAVAEGLARDDLQVELILSMKDGAKIINLKDKGAISQIATEVGGEEPLEILQRWYKRNKGRFPYAAVHIYGETTCHLGLHRKPGEQPQRVFAELRLIPKNNMQEALLARIPFQWEGPHVREVGIEQQ